MPRCKWSFGPRSAPPLAVQREARAGRECLAGSPLRWGGEVWEACPSAPCPACASLPGARPPESSPPHGTLSADVPQLFP